jgi:maltose O-acetyltransferase
MKKFLIKSVEFLMKYKERKYLNDLIRKGLKLGENVVIVDTFFFDPSHCYLISIGDNTIICPEVRLIAHDASIKKHLGYTKIGKITIKENCFIGDSSIVLPNVTIGPNSIVGAGSVVTKNVPPNTVAAGNPARSICSLDDYLNKVKKLVADSNKKVFSKEYSAERIDNKKYKELMQEVDGSWGFIK